MGRAHLSERLLRNSINQQDWIMKPYWKSKAVPLRSEHREGDLPASWGDFIAAINRWHQYYFAVRFAFVQHGQMIGFAGKVQCSGRVRTTIKKN